MSAKEKIATLRFRAEDARNNGNPGRFAKETDVFHAAALVLAGLEALAETLERPSPEAKRFDNVSERGGYPVCQKCHMPGCNGGAGCANLGDER